jgi:Zinc-binding dehydrogenase
VDVVFDTVGADTLERSWGVLRPGGRMITIASDSAGTTKQRVKDAFFIVEPNQKRLIEIAKQLDAEHLRAFVKATVPLNEALAAYRGESRAEADTGRSPSRFAPEAAEFNNLFLDLVGTGGPAPAPPQDQNDCEKRRSRNSPSLAVALNWGIGSSSWKAEVKALERLQIVRDRNSLYFGSNAVCIVTRSCAAHQTPIPIPR